MKKLLALMLVLMLVLSLAACGKDDSKETAGTTAASGTVPTTTPATTTGTTPGSTSGTGAELVGSDTKLAELDSFRFSLVLDNTVHAEVPMENVITMAYSYQKNADGTESILMEERVKYSQGDQSREYLEEQCWYDGTQGYSSWDGWYIKDDGFDLAYVVSKTGIIDLNIGNSTLIADFAALSPVKTVNADGTTLYRLENLSRENCLKLYMAMTGMSQEEAEQMPQMGASHAQAVVDANGYLTQFSLEMLEAQTGEGMQSAVVSLTMDQLNAVPTMTKPDFVNEFTLRENATITHIQNGWEAHYEVNSWNFASNGEPVLYFQGFGTYYWDSYEVDCYRVCDELLGVKVSAIQNVIENTISDVSVKTLIIPEGVRVGGFFGEPEQTENVTLFFEAPESEVEKVFRVVGDPYDPDLDGCTIVKAVYYAGQWELVNGIPQPR